MLVRQVHHHQINHTLILEFKIQLTIAVLWTHTWICIVHDALIQHRSFKLIHRSFISSFNVSNIRYSVCITKEFFCRTSALFKYKMRSFLSFIVSNEHESCPSIHRYNVTFGGVNFIFKLVPCMDFQRNF